MPAPVFYSISPFGTGTIETGAGNITITSGVATLTVEQTGNIGVGVAIEYDTEDISYIAPNRIGFDSGGTTELKVDTKIEDATSGATGIVRFVELLSGTWAGGDAAGWIYFESTTGTFGNNNTINRTKPTSSSNIATVDGTIEGNIGNGNTEFVVKSAIGADAANQTVTAVTSIHHEYASLSAFEAGFTDAAHINDTDLTNADVVAHACCYYDHDDYTVDSIMAAFDGATTSITQYIICFAPAGGSESKNIQRHLGAKDANKYLLVVSSDKCVFVKDNHVNLDGLQLGNSGGTSWGFGISMVYPTRIAGSYSKFTSLLIYATGESSYGVYSYGDHIDIDIINCVILDFDDSEKAGILAHTWTGGVHKIYHNTIYNCAYGILQDSKATTTIDNNAVFVCTDDFSVVITPDYCASDDEDGDHSQLLDGSGTPAYDTEFTDAAGGDFSLPVGSICIDNGTSLAASEGIWRDIAGNERGATPDIGAFEYVSSGSALTKILSDTISLSDVITKNLGLNKPDTINLSDSIIKKLGLNKSDSISMSDTFINSFGLNKSDTINLSDGFSNVASFLRTFDDTISIADNFSNVASFLRTLDDTINIADEATKEIGLNKDDTITLADNFSNVVSFLRTFDDTVNITDGFSNVVSFLRTYSDTVNIADDFSKVSAFLKTFDDTITLSDGFNAVITLILSLNDNISMSDEIAKGYHFNESDTISMSDNFSKVTSFIRTFTDTVNLSDEALKEIGLVLADSVTMSDDFNSLVSFILNLNDTISMSDGIAKEIGLAESDTINMVDNASTIAEFLRTFSDNISMSDEIAKTFGLTEADIISMADNFSTSMAAIYALLNFIAKNKTFNFVAKSKTFNFVAKNKTFNFNAKSRG